MATVTETLTLVLEPAEPAKTAEQCVEKQTVEEALAEIMDEEEPKKDEDVEEKKKLGIYIQVNTSGEDSKSGVSPGGELAELVKKILFYSKSCW